MGCSHQVVSQLPIRHCTRRVSVLSSGYQCASIALTHRVQRVEGELVSTRPTSRGRDLMSGMFTPTPLYPPRCRIEFAYATRCRNRSAPCSKGRGEVSSCTCALHEGGWLVMEYAPQFKVGVGERGVYQRVDGQTVNRLSQGGTRAPPPTADPFPRVPRGRILSSQRSPLLGPRW